MTGIPTQAEFDERYNKWFVESFNALMQPHIHGTNKALDKLARAFDHCADNIDKIVRALAFEKEADGKTKILAVSKVVTGLRAEIADLKTKQVEAAQVRTLQTTVTKLQAEISTLRAALGKRSRDDER